MQFGLGKAKADGWQCLAALAALDASCQYVLKAPGFMCLAAVLLLPAEGLGRAPLALSALCGGAAG